MKTTIRKYQKNVDKKLIIKQLIFFVIVTILLIWGVINILDDKINVTLAISGFLLALVIGLSLTRMFKIFWHEEREKVVSQLDVFGTVILTMYIGAELGRKYLFQYWLAGPELNAFGLVILTGLLLGRFIGTTIQIKNILKVKALGS